MAIFLRDGTRQFGRILGHTACSRSHCRVRAKETKAAWRRRLGTLDCAGIGRSSVLGGMQTGHGPGRSPRTGNAASAAMSRLVYVDFVAGSGLVRGCGIGRQFGRRCRVRADWLLRNAAVVWMSPDTNAASDHAASGRRCVQMHVRLRTSRGKKRRPKKRRSDDDNDDEVSTLLGMVNAILQGHVAGISEHGSRSGRNVTIEEADGMTLAPLKRTKRPVVRTNSLNLAAALALDGVADVDTNEISQVEELLGIEAAVSCFGASTMSWCSRAAALWPRSTRGSWPTTCATLGACGPFRVMASSTCTAISCSRLRLNKQARCS